MGKALGWCTMLLVSALAASAAYAQTTAPGVLRAYPVKPVRVLVGAPAGSGSDVITRITAQKLSERWSQSVVVDHVSILDRRVVVDCIQMTINMLLKKVPFDIRQAYVPVVELTSQPYVVAVNASLPVTSVKEPLMLVIHPSVAARTVKELVALARAKPGQLAYASSGSGGVSHLAGHLFMTLAGIELTHV